MAVKKKTPFGSFRWKLNAYLSILVFLFGLALIVLWLLLHRYQQGLDEAAAIKAEQDRQAAYELSLKRAPQLAFETFVADADADVWTERWYASHPNTYDDPTLVREKMDELFSNPDLSYWKTEDYSDEHPRYVIKDGDQALAYLTLSGSELDWKVTEAEVVMESTETSTLLVPEGYTVRCNGQIVDPAIAESETHLYDMEDYANLITDPIRWETYTVSGYLTPPVLTAEPPADRPTSTSEDGTVFYILSEEEAAGYQKRAENFIYALLSYYMLGNYDTRRHMDQALDYVMSGSQADMLIRNSYDGVTWDTCYGNAVYDAKAGEVRILAKNCLMVDVAYYSEGSALGYTNVAQGTYRIYFLDLGYGYGIYGLAYV